jgi:hypothetical protein
MIEPDFGEFQFLQLFNNELIHGLRVSGIQPIIPTQREEKDLGWDTGFRIPGLKLPDPSQKNCNLFLQYKIAKIIVGSQGRQWHYWRQSYFKFDIARWKSVGHPGGNYPDFHQYDALKNLVDNGYPTFYVPNHTVEVEELLNWANNNTIIDYNLALDIRHINRQHLAATFLKDSDHFFLDSDPEEIAKLVMSPDAVKEVLVSAKKTSLEEDLDAIPKLLLKYKPFSIIYETRFQKIKPGLIESRWLLLYVTLSTVFGLVWWKLPI